MRYKLLLCQRRCLRNIFSLFSDTELAVLWDLDLSRNEKQKVVLRCCFYQISFTMLTAQTIQLINNCAVCRGNYFQNRTEPNLFTIKQIYEEYKKSKELLDLQVNHLEAMSRRFPAMKLAKALKVMGKNEKSRCPNLRVHLEGNPKLSKGKTSPLLYLTAQNKRRVERSSEVLETERTLKKRKKNRGRPPQS